MRTVTDGIPVQIASNGATLEGELTVPASAAGVVVFVHGSGSSRFSRRNRVVADRLQQEGLGTLLLDLLTREEDNRDRETAELRFDVPLLTARVIAALEWAIRQPATTGLPIGIFAASTGAGAALKAAAARPGIVRAIVSRGGRPDFAGRALHRVKAPTLLIAGGDDAGVLEVNRLACDQLGCERHLEIIPGATHLFEEPGAIEEVARLAAAWFKYCFFRRAARSA